MTWNDALDHRHGGKGMARRNGRMTQPGEPCMSCGENRREPAPVRCLHAANHLQPCAPPWGDVSHLYVPDEADGWPTVCMAHGAFYPCRHGRDGSSCTPSRTPEHVRTVLAYQRGWNNGWSKAPGGT